MRWIIEHWRDVVTAIMAVVIAARVIVKLTPTPKDDTVLEKVVEFLKHVGLHVSTHRPELVGMYNEIVEFRKATGKNP